MATVQDHTRGEALDLVKRNEVLKAQVALEQKAQNQWHLKWGFLLNFEKVCLEVATKHGVSEEEYKKWITLRKSTARVSDETWNLKMVEKVPVTSSGMVGWRSRPADNLEKTGRLYNSPLHTLPPKKHISHIFLG